MLSVLTTKNTACSWSHIEALPCFILQHNLLTGSLQQNRAAVTHLLTATSSYLLLPISFRLTVKTSSLDSQYYINNTNMRKFGSETQWNTLLLITTALWETRCPLLIKSGSSRDFFYFLFQPAFRASNMAFHSLLTVIFSTYTHENILHTLCALQSTVKGRPWY